MDFKRYIANVRDFPKPGIMFKDISPLLADAKAFALVIESIAEAWSGKVDAVVALDARGFVFGAPVALKLGVPFIMLRKKGKLPGAVESLEYQLEYGSDVIEMKKGTLKRGMRTLVVDDLLATGGTAVAACALVEKVGAHVAGCAFVIELSFLNGKAKLGRIPVQSLTIYEE